MIIMASGFLGQKSGGFYKGIHILWMQRRGLGFVSHTSYVYLGHLLLLEGLEVEGGGGHGHYDPKKDDHCQNGRAVGRMAVVATHSHYPRSLNKIKQNIGHHDPKEDDDGRNGRAVGLVPARA